MAKQPSGILRLSTISLRSRSDTELIDRTNATDREFVHSRCLLHELFQRTVSCFPERPAVVHETGTLTYRELADRVDALTAALLASGVRQGDMVAVVMAKGWEQVVAVLAVPAAGGVFVPVDPGVPAERLHHLLAHAGATIAVTQPDLASRVEWPGGVEVLTVPGEQPAPAGIAKPAGTRTPDDLAYVIYTSGSTGQPKGVMISHAGAVNTILDINERFAVGAEDRVLALSSLTFDLAIYDIFGPLAVGAAIVVPSAAPVPDPDHWTDLVHRTGVTVWNSVPALMELAVAAAKPEALASVRLVLLSGDWIRVGLPDDIAEVCPGAEVISLGGATEGSIWSILYPVARVDPAWHSIPYGKPMANQRFFVLDRVMTPCPVGVPGELYIGGAGVAMGYWRDPERTAASFVRHPGTGERLYRTGDLGRYLPDGEIQFLGRVDFQVKIQGFRIELGEVEAALRQCPGVADAVAAADEDPSGAARLVAFVLGPVEPEAARAFVAGKLPAYMVPASVVVVDAWPLTGNGKVDRAALLRMSVPVPASAGDAPENALQELLVALWADVLGRDTVGVTDGFFALGGQSLLAARLVMAVNALLGTEVPVRAVFEAPTVAAFCDWLTLRPDVDVDALADTAAAVLADEPT